MARDFSLKLSKLRRRFARPKGTKRIGVLPSLMTLGNLLCGFLSLLQTANGRFEVAAWLILVAMIFDALDGKIARMTKVTSDFGAELDSLSDMIAFGAAPAFLVAFMSSYLPGKLAWLVGAVFVISVALRLARFNVETSPSEEHHRFFKGLPSPAGAGFVASLVILNFDLLQNGYEIDLLVKALPFVSLGISVLMISGVRYIHVLNTVLKGQRPFEYLAQLVFIVVFGAFTYPFSVALLFGVYVASGVYTTMKMRLTKPAESKPAEAKAPEGGALRPVEDLPWRTVRPGEESPRR
jgi:CDP-diacylglycerol--serine O-phosphatidyltransferase